jgi:hypothetical protein
MQDLELGVMFKQADFDPFEKPKEYKSFNFLNFFSSRKLIPVNLLAYGLVGVLAINFFSNSNQNNQGEANFQIVSLSPLRGSSDGEFNAIKVVEIDNNIRQVIIVVQLSFPEKENYSIALMKYETKEVVFEFDNLIPVGAGDLNISIPTKVIGKGNYIIKLSHAKNQIQNLAITFK